MLDRKIKDSDASVELLEDRLLMWKIMFVIFFIVGWASVVIGVVIIPYKYDEIIIGVGIAFLIFATWFFNGMNYYITLIKIEKTMKSLK